MQVRPDAASTPCSGIECGFPIGGIISFPSARNDFFASVAGTVVKATLDLSMARDDTALSRRFRLIVAGPFCAQSIHARRGPDIHGFGDVFLVS